MDTLVNHQTGYADVEGGRLYYETAGEGRALTLIHAGVADHTMWDDQFAEFARHYHVIRYDLRGFGKSTTESGLFSPRRDLYSLLAHLGVRRTYLVGVSLGGQAAIDFTLERPEMVDALIPVASGLSGFDFTPTAEEIERFSKMEEPYKNQDWERVADIDVDIWAVGFGRTADEVDPEVRRRLREMTRATYGRQDGEPKPLELESPAAARLAEIKAPTLVIVGNHDLPGVLLIADAIATGIPGARKEVIQGAAHMLNMEKPEEFNRLVLGFLSALP